MEEWAGVDASGWWVAATQNGHFDCSAEFDRTGNLVAVEEAGFWPTGDWGRCLLDIQAKYNKLREVE